MTILVGILCSDGIVVGADSSSTSGIGQFRVMEQPTEKISIVGSNIIVACSGHVGLAQRFRHIIEKKHAAHEFQRTKATHIDISCEVTKEVKENFKLTGIEEPDLSSLMAFVIKDQPHLVEFETKTLQPEFKNLPWFCSLGSGLYITDPFLGLLRRVFFSDGKMPDVPMGKFLCAWALRHAIDVNPGGINGPFRLAVLKRNESQQWGAELLCQTELEEHDGFIDAAEQYLAKFFEGKFSAAGAPAIPNPSISSGSMPAQSPPQHS